MEYEVIGYDEDGNAAHTYRNADRRKVADNYEFRVGYLLDARIEFFEINGEERTLLYFNDRA